MDERSMTDAEAPEGAAAPIPDAKRSWELPPFFVVGYVRSGTTLFRRMLNEHPDLTVQGELRIFQRIPPMLRGGTIDDAAGLEAFIAKQPPFLRETMFDMDLFRKLALPRLPLDAKTLLNLLKGAAREGAAKPHARWGHKEPHEWPFVYRLKEWYPEAQFIHILRAPQDVAGSVAKYADVQLHSVQTTPALSAWHWRVSARSVQAEGRKLGPARYHFLRYEDLVADPEPTLLGVCRFLRIDEAEIPKMLAFHEKPMKQHRGEHMERARGKLAPPEERRGKLSLSEDALRDVEWICRKEIEEFGYERMAEGEPSAFRKMQLAAMCRAWDAGWAGLRAYRRARGSL